MSIGTETFLRLLRGQQQAAPTPMANIYRPHQVLGARGPVPAPMALRRPTPPSAMPTAPKLSPMMQAIANRAAMSKLTPGAGQVGLPTGGAGGTSQPSAPTMPQGGGAPEATTFGQRFAQPQTQALLGAAIEGAKASGYQDRPVSLGQVLGRMGAGAMSSYQAAEDRIAAQQKAKLDELLTQAKIQTERAKGGQAFSGTSLTAQDSNNVLTLGQKVADGTATKTEEATYNMSWQRLSQPKPETRTATDGTVTTVTVPGMDLTGFPVPEGLQAGEKVIGEKAPTFNNDEKLAGAFTNRMLEATATFENVTAGGYDPANMRDFAAGNLPLALRASALSDNGQQYLAAKLNFITAVLRKESGAAISDTEFKNEDLKYFPQPGESAATIEQKRIARKTAIESMKAQSGGAFDYMQKKMKPSEIDQLPKGSVFMQRTGGVSYYKTPDGKVLAVD